MKRIQPRISIRTTHLRTSTAPNKDKSLFAQRVAELIQIHSARTWRTHHQTPSSTANKRKAGQALETKAPTAKAEKRQRTQPPESTPILSYQAIKDAFLELDIKYSALKENGPDLQWPDLGIKTMRASEIDEWGGGVVALSGFQWSIIKKEAENAYVALRNLKVPCDTYDMITQYHDCRIRSDSSIPNFLSKLSRWITLCDARLAADRPREK